MSTLTTQELGLLRSRPHSTKLWLSVYQPNTVLTCQVDDATIARGDYQITFDNVTAGAYSNVKSGMTVLIGTTVGAEDVGKLRVRSATATVLTVAENFHISWENNLYLTVIDFFEVWPIFPWYVQDGDTETWYKDYDIAYTNQNTALGTLVCMGSHRAAFVDDLMYFSATGTANVKGQALDYAWTFEGGTPASATAETPGYVSWNTPGHYTVSLAVTVQGTTITDTSYRHVSIYDRPHLGTNPPILEWELLNFQGSRDAGGYVIRIRIHQDTQTIKAGSLVVIFAEDVYGTTQQSIGGNTPYNGSIVFCGYINGDTIQYDYQNSFVEFEVLNVTGIMKLMEGPVVSVDTSTAPTTWFEVLDLSVQRWLYHYLRWHSSILMLTDVRYVGTDFIFQYYDGSPGTIYDTLSSFMHTALVGTVISDRQNLLWFEISPAVVANAKTALPLGMEIHKQDWINEPNISEMGYQQISYLEMGGVAWSDAGTGSSTAYLAGMPGNAVHIYSGEMQDHQGLILVDQAHLNTLAGNYFAYQNAKYPDSIFQMAGNYRNFDLAPAERQLLVVFPEDTRRGISLLNKPVHINRIDWQYQPETEFFFPVISVHELTEGLTGIPIDIPEVPLPVEPPPVTPPPVIPPFPPQLPPPPVIPPWTPLGPPYGSETCCITNSVEGPNSYMLSANGTIRNDDAYLGLGEPVIIGLLPYAKIRPYSASHPTYVWVNGTFESSTDRGVTWLPLTDASKYQINGVVNYDTLSLTALVPMSKTTTGWGKKFAAGDCFDLGQGAGFAVSLVPCEISGPLELAYSNQYVDWINNGSVLMEAEDTGLLHITYTGTDGDFYITFKLTGYAGDLPDGQLIAIVEVVTISGICSIAIGGAFLHGETPAIDGNGGPSQWVTTTEELTLLGPGGIPWDPTTEHYFGFGFSDYTSPVPYEAVIQIRKLIWHYASGGIEYDVDLFDLCPEIIRVKVNNLVAGNVC